MFLEANRTHHNDPTDPGQGLCKATSLVSPVQSLILLGALNTELQDLEVDLAVQKADQLAQNQGLEVQSLGHRVPNQDLKLQNPVHKVPSRDLRVQSPIPKVLRQVQKPDLGQSLGAAVRRQGNQGRGQEVHLRGLRAQ